MNEGYTGDFFVNLSTALFGGESSPSREHLERLGLKSKPDIIRERGKQALESKACSAATTFILKPVQLGHYVSDQLDNPLWSFRYGIFRHSVPGVRSVTGTNQLVNHLRNTVGYGLILPLGIIDAINSEIDSRRDKSTLGSKCKNTEQKRVYSSRLNDLALDPESFVDRLGLNPRDYQFSYSKTPLDFSCEKGYVRQFPILAIKFRNRSTRSHWLEDLYKKEETRRAGKGDEIELDIPV